MIGGQQLVIADGPATLLPSGNVLCQASPSLAKPSYFFEFDGTNLLQVPKPPDAPNIESYRGRMLLLPTGQVLFTDSVSNDVEIYTPTGSPDPLWAPTITSAPSTIVPGTTYVISGTQFNGLSQAVAYGDDSQAATNYPLVRITQNGQVFYARTHDHSTMAVATGNRVVSTRFDTPTGLQPGTASLVVVANGLSSTPINVTVQ
jgi:hypothetical protein